jgi:hypothetical protein
MSNIFNADSLQEQDILALIDNGAEESINLDFKAAGSLENTESKKNELAKDISAFANSDGGVIIYGITEKEHKAQSLSFINGNTTTKEWIEQIINSRIQQKIQGIIIHPIRFGNDINQTIYVVKIPQSSNAPHYTSDRKFYRRYNFQSVPMEEYEIRALYARVVKTNLEIEELHITTGSSMTSAYEFSMANYHLGFQIKNLGATIEDRYKLEIIMPKALFATPWTPDNPIMQYRIRQEQDNVIFSVPNQSPLFQQELTTAAVAQIQVTPMNWPIAKSCCIRSKLYYSGGVSEKEFSLAGKLHVRGRLIDDMI